jgi:hypothetical protein
MAYTIVTPIKSTYFYGHFMVMILWGDTTTSILRQIFDDSAVFDSSTLAANAVGVHEVPLGLRKKRFL